MPTSSLPSRPRAGGRCRAAVAAAMTTFCVAVFADSAEAPLPSSHNTAAVVPARDALIVATVKSRFAGDSRLQDSHISVIAIDGVVTLTGSASNLDAWSIAETIASGVDGVQIVDNQLQTHSPPDSGPK